ncbi:uncharacterized protein LOC114739108 [Neltuma alba]|uniref:uncharacterized protein LOC114739108 n=1 Tax=Neltuma alba TaxID=207710 RepID=UPI0010A2E87A|nr:uncharacterized protein LOC114739108 [Prosopis alba]
MQFIGTKGKSTELRLGSSTRKLKGVNLSGKETVRCSNPSSDEVGRTYVQVDGAFSYTSSTAACGGVIIDHNQGIKEGFKTRLISGDVLTAELWGCLFGLKRAWNSGFRNVVLRLDSSDAIRLLKDPTPELNEDWALIEEVKNMLKRNWRVECQLFDRDDNWMADMLAKQALNDKPGFIILGPDSVQPSWTRMA